MSGELATQPSRARSLAGTASFRRALGDDVEVSRSTGKHIKAKYTGLNTVKLHGNFLPKAPSPPLAALAPCGTSKQQFGRTTSEDVHARQDTPAGPTSSYTREQHSGAYVGNEDGHAKARTGQVDENAFFNSLIYPYKRLPQELAKLRNDQHAIPNVCFLPHVLQRRLERLGIARPGDVYPLESSMGYSTAASKLELHRMLMIDLPWLRSTTKHCCPTTGFKSTYLLSAEGAATFFQKQSTLAGQLASLAPTLAMFKLHALLPDCDERYLIEAASKIDSSGTVKTSYGSITSFCPQHPSSNDTDDYEPADELPPIITFWSCAACLSLALNATDDELASLLKEKACDRTGYFHQLAAQKLDYRDCLMRALQEVVADLLVR